MKFCLNSIEKYQMNILILGESHREPKREENHFSFHPSNMNTCSPEYLEVMSLKSHLCLRMLEKRIGAEQLLQVES